MGRFVTRVQALALALGAPGLFLVALLDSSVLSLPEIADLLVIWMVVQHKQRLILYATSATLGSIAGCLALYYIGRKGGDALVRKRFHSLSVDRTLASFQRYGVVTVLIPSILPPPAPFKIFVLIAGVAHIDVRKFVLAVAIGRGVRYLLLGVLAVEYGDRALAYMHENSVTASLIAVGILVAGFVAYLIWSKRS
ncbi:MAG TPA: VTT domain-containing protein [Vicinamibacterales bacterium]|nr:VTT domain-containing protein [Vicinamibacterales bacterium]